MRLPLCDLQRVDGITFEKRTFIDCLPSSVSRGSSLHRGVYTFSLLVESGWLTCGRLAEVVARRIQDGVAPSAAAAPRYNASIHFQPRGRDLDHNPKLNFI